MTHRKLKPHWFILQTLPNEIIADNFRKALLFIQELNLRSPPFPGHCFPLFTRPSSSMMVPWVPMVPWTAALIVLLSRETQGGAPPENHLLRALHECYADSNGTQRFIMRCIFNREEFMRFDSAVGEFRALTPMGRPWAESWNKQKTYMERRRSEVDTVCRHNYELNQAFTVKRRVQPKVHVSPSKKVTLKHHDLLVCHVTDFYPGSIQVRWFQNSQEETAGVVSTSLIRNGDWTFQTLVMLEITPQRGDVYTCHVEHPSLESPVTVEWRIQSDSAQNKMLTGVVGLVLGLIFLTVGTIKHVRNKQAQLRSPGSR